MTTIFCRHLAALALALTVSTAAHAIPLSDLFAGDSIQAGDKLFDQWELLDYDATDGRDFNATNIDVTALEDGGLDPGPGLNFDVLDNELRIGGDGIFAFVDLMFGFRVSVLEPTLFVKDASLGLRGGLIISAGLDMDTGMFILELLDADSLIASGDPDDADLGTMETEFSILDGSPTTDLSSAANFPPRKSLFVTKNILVWAGDVNESAQLFQFQQRFSQIERTTVPEPGTLALSLLALGGVGALRRLRRA